MAKKQTETDKGGSQTPLKLKQIAIPQEIVMSKIYEVRGQKVMLDRDLAELMMLKQ